MKMTKEEFFARKRQAEIDNAKPDTTGNNLMFGERQQCLKPTILNSKREALGFDAQKSSFFNQCLPKRF